MGNSAALMAAASQVARERGSAGGGATHEAPSRRERPEAIRFVLGRAGAKEARVAANWRV